MSAKTRTLLIVLGSLLLAGVIVALLIFEEESYEVLWEDVAQGTVGLEPGSPVEEQVFEIPLEASDKPRFLRIAPEPESGWGHPNFDIGVNLEDPDGNVVAALPRDHVFKAPDNEDRQYVTSLEFTVPQDGVYTLYVIPRSVHIDFIRLQVREKK